MRILISNDDGYRAAGINALYRELKSIAQVEIIAPEHNNSAKSNAITVSAPIYLESIQPDISYCTGTPADCVHLALYGVLDYQPDLVVTGINCGANMGNDTLYSGTVGAAMEGYFFGIPSIAFSQVKNDWSELESAAKFAKQFIQHLCKQGLNKQPWLLNVNIPNLPINQIKGCKITRLGKRHAAEKIITQQSPRGKTMYWFGSAGKANDSEIGTDFHTVKNNFVSVTPLQVDLTNHDVLQYWGQSINNLPINLAT